MTFPVTFQVFGLSLSAHAPLELLAWVAGFLVARWDRRRTPDPVDAETRSSLLVASVFGAIAGGWLVHVVHELPRRGDLGSALLGKSIVGGLLGGTLAVEWWKKRQGVTRRTGDALVLALCVSIAIGRVGCFLAGLGDHTAGTPTSLPWGVDFGDGVTRHPTQLYEVLFVLALGLALRFPRRLPEGARFDLFLLGYLAFRLVIDFWKPEPTMLGLAGTQWAALVGILWRAPWLVRTLRV